MKLFKLVIIVSACALFVVACSNSNSTNQPATGNAPATANANAPTSAATPADQLADARKMFSQGGVCARCHGETGEGGEFDMDGKKMKAPNLRTGHAVKMTDDQIAKKIANGGDGMPKFGTRLSPEQINNLVRFIRQDLEAGASTTNANNSNAAPKK
jgi:mono/diheme cytochrome c family protein